MQHGRQTTQALQGAATAPPSIPARAGDARSASSTQATMSVPGRPVLASTLSAGPSPAAAAAAVGGGRPPLPPPRPQNTISAITRDLPTMSARRSRPFPPNTTPLSLSSSPVTPPVPETPRSPSPKVVSSITLAEPRPGPDRSDNLYVDSPVKLPHESQQATGSSRRSNLNSSYSSSVSSSSQKTTVSSSSVIQPNSLSLFSSSDLLKQKRPPPPVPGKATRKVVEEEGGKKALKKQQLKEDELSDFQSISFGDLSVDEGSSGSDSDQSSGTFPEDSIICRTCGRCRCEECARPRNLPDRWLCNNKCHLSADTVVDTLSCMWLVKALLFHCAREEDEEGKSSFEKPCSCSGSTASIVARWTCIGAASLAMPCLCCYPPLKGVQRCVEGMHRKVSAVGCKCQDRQQPQTVAVISSPPQGMSSIVRSNQLQPVPARDSAKKSLLG